MRRTPFAHIFILIAFVVNTFGPASVVYAQDFVLPKPGVMVHLSPEFNPPILKGIKVHPDNPFRFDFILDKGDYDSSVIPAKAGIQNSGSPTKTFGDDKALKQESTKLIKYFLASLTIPEKDLWVNLSPYEKERIIPPSFGVTEMGRDLLAEDYMLKQITASLIYPEDEIGKKFWKRIYEEAQKKYHTTNISVNTFNKVWIVPEKAVVYENAKAGTAYVVESKLKVMLEEDYLSLSKHDDVGAQFIAPSKEGSINRTPTKDVNTLGSQIVREIVIPELTKEVNENKNFAQLRQVYNSLILATWYKKKIKDSILSQVYADKNKISGIGIHDVGATLRGRPISTGQAQRPAPTEILDTNTIYQRYLSAFKKGVYNYIKEEPDPITQTSIPRKYFSGGENLTNAAMAPALNYVKTIPNLATISFLGKSLVLSVMITAASILPSYAADSLNSQVVVPAVTQSNAVTILPSVNEHQVQTFNDDISLGNLNLVDMFLKKADNRYQMIEMVIPKLDENQLKGMLKGFKGVDINALTQAYQTNNGEVVGKYLNQILDNERISSSKKIPVVLDIFTSMKILPESDVTDKIFNAFLEFRSQYASDKHGLVFHKYFSAKHGFAQNQGDLLILMLSHSDGDVRELAYDNAKKGMPDISPKQEKRLRELFTKTKNIQIKGFLLNVFSHTFLTWKEEFNYDLVDIEGLFLGINDDDTDHYIRQIAWSDLRELPERIKFLEEVPAKEKEYFSRVIASVMKLPDTSQKYYCLRDYWKYINNPGQYLSSIAQAINNGDNYTKLAAMDALTPQDLSNPLIKKAIKQQIYNPDNDVRNAAGKLIIEGGAERFITLADLDNFLSALKNGSYEGLSAQQAAGWFGRINNLVDGIAHSHYFDDQVWPAFEEALFKAAPDSQFAKEAGFLMRYHFQVEGRQLDGKDSDILLEFMKKGGNVETVDSILFSGVKVKEESKFQMGLVRAVAQRIQEFGGGRATVDDILTIYKEPGFIKLTSGISDDLQRLSLAFEVAELIKDKGAQLTPPMILKVTDYFISLNARHDQDPVIKKGGTVYVFLHEQFNSDEEHLRALAKAAGAKEIIVKHGKDLNEKAVTDLIEVAPEHSTFIWDNHGAPSGDQIISYGISVSSTNTMSAIKKNPYPQVHVFDSCYADSCGGVIARDMEGKPNDPLIVVAASKKTTASTRGLLVNLESGKDGQLTAHEINDTATRMGEGRWGKSQEVRIYPSLSPEEIIERDKLFETSHAMRTDINSQPASQETNRAMINDLKRVLAYIPLDVEQGNYQKIVRQLSPFQHLLAGLEGLGQENEWSETLMRLKRYLVSAQVALLQQEAYGLVSDGDLMRGRERYEESWGLINANRGFVPQEFITRYQNGIKKINTLSENFQDLNDINNYKKFLNMEDTLETVITNHVFLDAVEPNLHVIIVKQVKSPSMFPDTVYKAYTMFIVLKNADYQYQLAGEAGIDLEGKSIIEPTTLTYIKGQGYMQRAIKILLKSKTIAIWRSSGSMKPKAREMYARMMNDPELLVHAATGVLFYTVSLSPAVVFSAAMNASKNPETKQAPSVDQTKTGGIDLTPANMNLQTQNNGSGEITFHMNPAMLAQLQNAPGFTPLIINITPLDNLGVFLGIT